VEWLIVGGIIAVVLIVALISIQQDREIRPAEPDAIRIEPRWKRCTIRAERARTPERPWVHVRISFFRQEMQQPDVVWSYERVSREQMDAFEKRLKTSGWSTQAEGTSEKLPKGFDRMERTVIYTR
jgi:hypothetical protein